VDPDFSSNQADPITGEISDLVIGGIPFYRIVIPGFGWGLRCGDCWSMVGPTDTNFTDNTDSFEIRIASRHTVSVHSDLSPEMLVINRNELATRIEKWAQDMEANAEFIALAAMIRNGWP
jgi:hypothetical protein